jgi:hypothetical protein
MGVPKISNFIIGLIIISLCSVTFSLYINGYVTNYGINASTENIETFNRLNDLNTNVKELEETTTTFQEKTGLIDIIGGYFSNAYNSLKVAFNSIGVFDSMLNSATENPELNNPIIKYLKQAIVSIVIIIIILGVIISAVVKKDV